MRVDRRTATVAIFGLWMAAPWAGQWFELGSPWSAHENRNPAPFPNLRPLAQFPADFERYYNDHFGFRNDLIRWHHRTKHGAGLGSTSSEVVVGEEGWLYLFDDSPAQHARGPIEPAGLPDARRVIGGTRRLCERAGARYLLVVVPDKTTVYPEHMPRGFRLPPGIRARRAQLLSLLRDELGESMLHLAQTLLEAKPQGQLFHQTDSHWNELGAWVGFERIMARLSLPSRPLADFEIVEAETLGGDLSRMMGLAEHVRERRSVSLRPRGEPPSPSGLRLLLVHDSFTWALEVFFNSAFAKVRYERQWSPQLLSRERPDVVIHQVRERDLDMFPARWWTGPE